MTDVPVDDPETLRRILANTEALLLDFDGPICSVFAGFPARVVAEQLRQVLAQGGHDDLPSNVAFSTDPFDVLRHAATLGQVEAEYVEAAFRAHEVEAVHSARPTRDSHRTIANWKSAGKKVAIVSNNSTVAIQAYLAINKLSDYVDVVAGRESSAVSLLKPSPYLVRLAAKKLDMTPNCCTLIGDSSSDIQAAHAGGVEAVGFANRPEKIDRLRLENPRIVITQMAKVAALTS